jgi:hypothetical protein
MRSQGPTLRSSESSAGARSALGGAGGWLSGGERALVPHVIAREAHEPPPSVGLSRLERRCVPLTCGAPRRVHRMRWSVRESPATITNDPTIPHPSVGFSPVHASPPLAIVFTVYRRDSSQEERASGVQRAAAGWTREAPAGGAGRFRNRPCAARGLEGQCRRCASGHDRGTLPP